MSQQRAFCRPVPGPGPFKMFKTAAADLYIGPFPDPGGTEETFRRPFADPDLCQRGTHGKSADPDLADRIRNGHRSQVHTIGKHTLVDKTDALPQDHFPQLPAPEIQACLQMNIPQDCSVNQQTDPGQGGQSRPVFRSIFTGFHLRPGQKTVCVICCFRRILFSPVFPARQTFNPVQQIPDLRLPQYFLMPLRFLLQDMDEFHDRLRNLQRGSPAVIVQITIQIR